MRTIARSALLLLACLAALFAPASPALAQLDNVAIRLIPAPSPRGPGSSFTNNMCNAPCVCIIDPIPQPVGGRLYLCAAVSIPEISAMRGHARLAPTNPLISLDHVVSGTLAYTVTRDPAALERLSLETTFQGQAWTLDSGIHVLGELQFPNLRATLVSQQLDCTTLHAILWGAVTCPTDFDDGSGLGLPDGAVTIDDLLFFLHGFADGAPTIDIDDGSGNGILDDAVTIDDLLYFLRRFEGGC